MLLSALLQERDDAECSLAPEYQTLVEARPLCSLSLKSTLPLPVFVQYSSFSVHMSSKRLDSTRDASRRPEQSRAYHRTLRRSRCAQEARKNSAHRAHVGAFIAFDYHVRSRTPGALDELVQRQLRPHLHKVRCLALLILILIRMFKCTHLVILLLTCTSSWYLYTKTYSYTEH